jgi:hypothetical protein
MIQSSAGDAAVYFADETASGRRDHGAAQMLVKFVQLELARKGEKPHIQVQLLTFLTGAKSVRPLLVNRTKLTQKMKLVGF